MPSSQISMVSFYPTRSRVEIILPCCSPVTNAEEDKKSSQTYCCNCVQPNPTSFVAPFHNDEELPAAGLAASVASRCLDTCTRRPHNRCRPNAKRQAISDGRPYRHYKIFVPTKGISLTYFLPATICAIHSLLGSCFADEERQRLDVSRAVRACVVVAGAIVHQDVRKKG